MPETAAKQWKRFWSKASTTPVVSNPTYNNKKQRKIRKNVNNTKKINNNNKTKQLKEEE